MSFWRGFNLLNKDAAVKSGSGGIARNERPGIEPKSQSLKAFIYKGFSHFLPKYTPI